MPASKPKVALVHDWLYGGGAEQVVLALHKLYPDAPIYTSYCTDEWRKKLHNKVETGYLQGWFFVKLYKFLPLLRQWWFARLDLSEFDIVISSSGNGEAKFALSHQHPASNVQRPIHICYCHTPTHFYWRKYNEYLKNPGFRPEWLVRFGLKMLVKPLRRRDFKAAQRVDYFIANSSHIQKDIKKYYKHESTVIHPPVDIERFLKGAPSKRKQNSLIAWGRHVPDKRFDIAIKAIKQLEKKLVIVGEGPETKHLKKLAGEDGNVVFTGKVSDARLATLAMESEAFIFPAEDDFGIAPVEALSAGIPVIAYKAGGALDYIEPGKTGEFFEPQTAHALLLVLQKFDARKYDRQSIQAYAGQFSAERFAKEVQTFVDTCQKERLKNMVG